LVAITVKVEELPRRIDMGLAVIPTVGATVEPVTWATPQPVKNKESTEAETRKERIGQADLKPCAFFK
jgi:hypothetical protein